MARKKLSVKQYTVSVSEAQKEALDKLMKEDMQENVSQYFGYLISEVTKMREGNKARRAVGRPKKEEGGEELYYPAPYDKNAPPYTMADLEAYYTYRGEAVPPQGKPFTKEELKKWL